MPAWPMAVVLLTAGTLSAASSVDVHGGAGWLEVRARAAPLRQVLDEIGRQTGMRILYEGDVGQLRLTMATAGTPADVVLRLVGGAGLGCVLQFAGQGPAVRTLVVAAGGEAASDPPAAAPPLAARRVHVWDVLPTDPGFREERLRFDAGQPVHWKVVITDEEGRPVPATQVEAELVGPDRRVAGTLSAMTGTDGTALFAHTIEAPVPGTYTIRVRGLAPESSEAAYEPELNLRSATTISVE